MTEGGDQEWGDLSQCSFPGAERTGDPGRRLCGFELRTQTRCLLKQEELIGVSDLWTSRMSGM